MNYQGDATNGAKLFKKLCWQCHTIEKFSGHKSGPNLYNLIGRTSGTGIGYMYTMANRKAKVEWNEQNLFEYLKEPTKFIPGTKMVFKGIKSEKDRLDLIEFIKQNRDN